MNFELLLDLDYLIIHKDHSTIDYDPNSGESYDVKIFYLTNDNEIDYLQLGLGKPSIYGIKETIIEEYNYYLKKKINLF